MSAPIIISKSFDIALLDPTDAKCSWLIMAPKFIPYYTDSLPAYETKLIADSIREAIDKAKELVARCEEYHDAHILFSIDGQPDVNLVNPNDDIELIKIILANS